MKNKYILTFLSLFLFTSIHSSDIRVLPTVGSWNYYGAYISDLDIELTSDHHYARVEMTFYVNVDSIMPYSGTNGWSGGNLPTYRNQMLEAMLDFNMPKGAYFYDSYLWLNETTIVRADIIGKGEANQIYNGIVNRQMDPSILNKEQVYDNYGQVNSNHYSLKIFPISTTFRRKVKIAYAIPFIAYQSNKEYFELPTEIINFMKENSKLKFTINKSLDMNFSNVAFPLSYKTTADNSLQTILELDRNEISKTNKNYIEFTNVNPKLISFYSQAINAEEGYYDIRIRTSQLTDLPTSISVYEIKIPIENSGIIFSRNNNSNDMLLRSDQYFESGKYHGALNFNDSITLNFKGTTGTQSIKQAISINDKSNFIFQNWTNLLCEKTTSKEALSFSLKNRVLSSQTAFLALETGDTVLVAKSNDMIDGGGGFVAIQQVNENLNISIYPNPFVDKIKVTAKESILSIRIVSLTGQTVYSHSYPKMTNEIEISENELNFNSGIYFIQVETKSGMESIRILKE